MKIREFHQYISPDGKVYDLVTASRKGRWVMQSQGWGTPPIEYITQRGAFQHGETVKDFFLTPRTIQILIDQSFCNREAQWTGRATLLDAIRPNRQTSPTGATPGTLRRILPDGSKRDLKVFISEGPTFDPSPDDGWQEHSFKEVLKFVAYDPVIFDPTVQSYVEDFSTAGHTLDLQISNSADDILCYYYSAMHPWLLSSALTLAAGYNSSSVKKMGTGLVFRNFTVPYGAIITLAYLQFKSLSDANSTTVNSRIIGQKERTPAAFSTIADYQIRRGTVVGGPDDSKLTTAYVDWDNIGTWWRETWYNSPDIATIIQEITDLGISGLVNAICLFWDDHEARGTQSAAVYRPAKRFEDSSADAAKLHIEYSTAGITNITYLGTWLTYPTIIITGPLNDAVITNQETGEKIQLDYNIPAGRIVTIDLAYGVKTIKDDLGVNLIGVLSADSDLATFHIAPDPEVANGLNHISITGTGESIGTTQIEIQFYTRYIGI
jgi:hypothetical protein